MGDEYDPYATTQRLTEPSVFGDSDPQLKAAALVLNSSLILLLSSLYSWQTARDIRTAEVRQRIDEQRFTVKQDLLAHPALNDLVTMAIARAWTIARLRASQEMGTESAHAPLDCPFRAGQVLSVEWYPE